MTLEAKWAATVAGLSLLLGRTTDYEAEANPRDAAWRRWELVKQLIQSVKPSLSHSQSRGEDSSTSFVPPNEDRDPITMLYHLLCRDSAEFQQSLILSCCVQLNDKKEDGLSPVDLISTSSLLQLFLMFSQEVDFFDQSTSVKRFLIAWDQPQMGDDEGPPAISLTRRLLTHIDGRVVPLLLLVSRVLSQLSGYCLVGALLTTRSQLLDQLLDEEKEAQLLPFMSYATVNSVAMEGFVSHILSEGIPSLQNVILPVVSNGVSDRELLQLYKDNQIYREHLETLLSNIENKKIRSHPNGSG
ncbi:unnamed protein product [Phytomonas sp. Hart1]|nr:unnamed protein product [Phytomonas sp. Hart1]|eukprot:CCW71614.1 unnamed protein product [Phytomonas sp. isolate Hart1]